MTARRISDIVKGLMRAKALGARLKGKSVLERELQAWFDQPEIPLPAEPHGGLLAQETPDRYEDVPPAPPAPQRPPRRSVATLMAVSLALGGFPHSHK